MTSMEYTNENLQELEDENNLETYLEQQIKEYTSECESMKAMYMTLMDHIKECKTQINSLKAKEDVGFSMFSPIPVESAYQTQIIRMEGQLEAYEKQREKYVKDIRFYEAKIEEMESQLEEYRSSESVRKETIMQDMEIAATDILRDNCNFEECSFSENNDLSSMDEQNLEKVKELQLLCDSQKEKERANYDYIAHKIAEIKGYINVDIMRSKMEIERLEQYLKNLME